MVVFWLLMYEKTKDFSTLMHYIKKNDVRPIIKVILKYMDIQIQKINSMWATKY